MANIETFTRRIRRIAKNVKSRANAGVIRTALAIDQAVVLATPVDTGRARGNWQASLGTSIMEPIDRLDPSGSSTIAANTGVIKGRKKEGQDVFISNNLDYIGRLNEGSSAQAPAGFVERAILAGQTAVAKITLIKR